MLTLQVIEDLICRLINIHVAKKHVCTQGQIFYDG